MMTILINLEPYFHEKKKMILGELEECNQIYFIEKGKVIVGYELNNQKRYCVRFNNKSVIGAYEMTFFRRSAYIYTALRKLEGYFIRKSHWKTIVSDKNLEMVLKRNILMSYLVKIQMKVNMKKKVAQEFLNSRNDQDMYKITSEKNLFEIKENFKKTLVGYS